MELFERGAPVDSTPCLRFAHGVEFVRLAATEVLVRTARGEHRISGRSVDYFVTQIAPLLREGRPLEELERALPEVPPEELRRHLDSWIESGIVLQTRPESQGRVGRGVAERAERFSRGSPAERLSRPARATLAAARVGILGLEGHGYHLARMLCRYGIGTMVLADPYPMARGNLRLFGGSIPAGSVGEPREEAVRSALSALGARTGLIPSGRTELSRESVDEIVAGCDLIVSCFDRGLRSVHFWANRASLRRTIPALYCEAGSSRSTVGPLVLPGRTACYMCFRMRVVACAEDFHQAMDEERRADRQKQAVLAERGISPASVRLLASALCSEVLGLLQRNESRLAGWIADLDPLVEDPTVHPVLRRFDCPVCGDGRERNHPDMDALARREGPRGHLRSARDRLLSERTGIFRGERPIPVDGGDLPSVHCHAVEISNHRFEDVRTWGWQLAGGKGFDREEAADGAFGEGVERYSGAVWRPSEIRYARRSDLPPDALDPRQLVLHAPGNAPDQGGYARYDGKNVLGWIPARSLVTGTIRLVPAVGVLMKYVPRLPEEWICGASSNGLAAGPTLLDAVWAATLEVIERDAFLLSWMTRVAGVEIDARSHPDAAVVNVVLEFAAREVVVRLLELRSDHPVSVFCACAIHSGRHGPAFAVGLGTHFDPALAARKAVLELGQTWQWVRHQMRMPHAAERIEALVREPLTVSALPDHPLLYADPRMLPAVDFLFDGGRRPGEWEPLVQTKEDHLRALAAHLGSSGYDLLYCNLTPPELAELGLHTARVIIPDHQPIHFGTSQPRLAERRLREFPAAFGFPPASELNPYPHPVG